MPRIASHPTYPSVTEILGAAGLTRDYRGLDDRYSLLGQALHETIHWHHLGTLDESSIHPEVRPGFDAYLEFLEQASHVPLYSELQLVHPHGFVGRLDRIGSVGSVETALIDWTYTDSPDLKGKRYQVAGGYRLLWEHLVEKSMAEARRTAFGPMGVDGRMEKKAERCYVVALHKDGSPRCHDVTDDYAMQIFLAAMIVERAKREK